MPFGPEHKSTFGESLDRVVEVEVGPTEADRVTVPTVEDNSQNWAGMDGATAFLLIDRHADNWADIGKMMDEWLAANQKAFREGYEAGVRDAKNGTVTSFE